MRTWLGLVFWREEEWAEWKRLDLLSRRSWIKTILRSNSIGSADQPARYHHVSQSVCGHSAGAGSEHVNRRSSLFMNFHRHHCDSFKFNSNVTCSHVVGNAIKMKFNGCADVCHAFEAWLELRWSLTRAKQRRRRIYTYNMLLTSRTVISAASRLNRAAEIRSKSQKETKNVGNAFAYAINLTDIL